MLEKIIKFIKEKCFRIPAKKQTQDHDQDPYVYK